MPWFTHTFRTCLYMDISKLGITEHDINLSSEKRVKDSVFSGENFSLEEPKFPANLEQVNRYKFN